MDRYKAREIVLTDSSLSRNARLLYQIVDHHRSLSETLPSLAFLARDMGCNARSVSRYLAELRRAGLL